jgi:hypothetical protein
LKVVERIALIERGAFAASLAWRQIRDEVVHAVEQAEWPVGSGSFTIYPQSGKKSGEGNGVVPIKAKPMAMLKAAGWSLEFPWAVGERPDEAAVVERVIERAVKGSRPGDIDAARNFSQGLVVVEWETGNVSSSHRSINKIALGLRLGQCIAGILVVPNMRLARYLTDRIGNIEELRSYFPMWRAVQVENGALELLVIEQDAESDQVPRIPKGKDGRAKEGAASLIDRLEL